MTENVTLICLSDMANYVGVSRNLLLKLMKDDPEFPKECKFSGRKAGKGVKRFWKRAEIDEYFRNL